MTEAIIDKEEALAKTRRALIASGLSEKLVAAWDPDLRVALPMAEGVKKIRIAKAIGDGQFEGDEWYEEARFTPKQMIEFLESAGGDPVVIELNSPGGSVFGGSEIATAINEYEGETTAFVTSVAGSMASVIAAACDKVILAKNAMIMIHSASSICLGNSRDMREMADFLEKATSSMAVFYEKRMDKDAVAQLLDGTDHWMTAEEALEASYADEVKELKKAGGKKADAESGNKSECDLRRKAAAAEMARMAHFGI